MPALTYPQKSPANIDHPLMWSLDHRNAKFAALAENSNPKSANDARFLPGHKWCCIGLVGRIQIHSVFRLFWDARNVSNSRTDSGSLSESVRIAILSSKVMQRSRTDSLAFISSSTALCGRSGKVSRKMSTFLFFWPFHFFVG